VPKSHCASLWEGVVRRRFVPLLLFLVLAFVLVFVVDDFVQRVIVAPVLSAAWFVTVVVTSLPQFIFWGVFVLAALVIAAKSVGREKTFKPRPERAPASQRGPVASWFSLLERAKTQEFSRWRLAQAIRKLTWDIRSPNHSINQHHIEEVGSGWTLPPEIEAYFGAPMPSFQRLPRFWGRLRVKGPTTALDLDPEEVIEYLEKESDPLLGENG
jgi:hypothetical protein